MEGMAERFGRALYIPMKSLVSWLDLADTGHTPIMLSHTRQEVTVPAPLPPEPPREGFAFWTPDCPRFPTCAGYPDTCPDCEQA